MYVSGVVFVLHGYEILTIILCTHGYQQRCKFHLHFEIAEEARVMITSSL